MSDKANVAGHSGLSISWFGRGIRSKGAVACNGNGTGPDVKNKRGIVSGFSAASRRRLRDTLLRAAPRPGWVVLGVTLTVPGPVLSEAERRRLWDVWKRKVSRKGWAVIWRREDQARGQPHWHCLFFVVDGAREVTAEQIRGAWCRVLGVLGPVTCDTGRGRLSVFTGLRGSMPGARLHACHVEGAAIGDSAGWLRYLCDHASKRKAGQISQNGRAWGVINRERIAWEDGEREQLSVGEYVLFLRGLQRWQTVRVRARHAPFGCKLGFRCRRGRWGASSWFCDVAAGRRLVAWARAEAAARGPDWLPQFGPPPWLRNRKRKRAAMHPDVRRGLWFVELSEKSGAGRLKQAEMFGPDSEKIEKKEPKC